MTPSVRLPVEELSGARWRSASLREICRNIIDYRGRTPKKLGMEWGGGEIPALSARNVKMGFIDFSEECYVGSEELYQRWMTNGDVGRGDVVITLEAPLGNVALISDDRRYIMSQRTVLLQLDRSQVDERFVFHYLSSPGFQRLLYENATGSTALGIKRQILETLAIEMPPLAEQHAITTALSDVDALLTALDRLIAKKRDLKQGVMQELLTGRRRLPGFGGEWPGSTLGRHVQVPIRNGYSPVCRTTETGLWTLSLAAVTEQGFDSQGIKPAPLNDSLVLENILLAGDLVVSRSNTPDRVGLAGLYRGAPAPCSYPDLMMRVRLTASLLPEYALAHLLSPRGRRFFLSSARGSSSSMVKIDRATLGAFEIPVLSLAEQSAIISVLSDMDAELTALEARRDKTRLLKQGMMQELLTGRTRLV